MRHLYNSLRKNGLFWIGSTIAPILLALLLLPARNWLTVTDVAMIQLLWVTYLARWAGERWAITATVISVILLDWFYVSPYHTLFIHNIDYLVTFLVMLLLGIFIARLSGKLRRELAKTRIHLRNRRKQANKIRAAKTQAEAEQHRAMMLRSLSHDLRTPLATIMGSSSMLADKELPLTSAEIHQQASNIYQQSCLLSAHFDKVMELSKVQLTPAILQWESGSIAEVISSAVARRNIQLNEQALQITLPPDASCVADLALIEIALANMLENALKHGKLPIHIRFSHTTEHYQLTVMNMLDRDNSSQRDSGAGLGVPICQAIMQLHHGQFTLQAYEHNILAGLCWPSPQAASTTIKKASHV